MRFAISPVLIASSSAILCRTMDRINSCIK